MTTQSLHDLKVKECLERILSNAVNTAKDHKASNTKEDVEACSKRLNLLKTIQSLEQLQKTEPTRDVWFYSNSKLPDPDSLEPSTAILKDGTWTLHSKGIYKTRPYHGLLIYISWQVRVGTAEYFVLWRHRTMDPFTSSSVNIIDISSGVNQNLGLSVFPASNILKSFGFIDSAV